MNIQQFDTTEKWLEARKTGIGGSDSSAVLGVNPYSKPIDVWARKTGVSPEVQETEKMHFGHVLETAIADEYAKQQGVKFQGLKNPLIRKPGNEWLFVSPDRLIDGQNYGLEVKNIGEKALDIEDAKTGEPLWGAPGTDQVPLYYLFQCQHAMLVTGMSRWDMAVLFGGCHYRAYTIQADKELHDYMFDALQKFWQDYVLKKVPPPPSSQEPGELKEYLKIRYRKNNGEILKATPELLQAIGLLQKARLDLDIAENEKTIIENKIKAIIGDADGVEFEALGKAQKITWKASKDSAKIDWQQVVQDLGGASFGIIQKNTRVIPGARRFVVPRSWGQEKGE